MTITIIIPSKRARAFHIRANVNAKQAQGAQSARQKRTNSPGRKVDNFASKSASCNDRPTLLELLFATYACRARHTRTRMCSSVQQRYGRSRHSKHCAKEEGGGGEEEENKKKAHQCSQTPLAGEDRQVLLVLSQTGENVHTQTCKKALFP